MLHYSGKKSILLFIVLLFHGALYSQLYSFKNQQLWIKADDRFDSGDYLGALKIYEQLIELDSTNDELNFRVGECNYNIPKYKSKALHYFNKVNPELIPETNYYLGKIHSLNKNYNAAINCFSNYKNNDMPKTRSLKEVQDEIDKCYTAIRFEEKKSDSVRIENLGPLINSSYADYAPLISVNEDFLLFTSRRKNEIHKNKDPLGEYFEDIYISKKINGKWAAAEILSDTLINTPLHDAGTGLSSDGKKLLVYRTSPDLKSGDIYESIFNGVSFTSPVIIPTNVNSKKYLETSACYSPDNNTIFFSSNRPGGYGGKDLYYMKRLPNGKWGAPFNLGPTINTEYNEDAPYIHPLNNVLFFSSEGHTNMGGYDIFKSYFDDEGKFTSPENLGSPINTNDNDIFFVLNVTGTTAYFSSERAGGYGSQDIYKAMFDPPVYLHVYHVIIENTAGHLIEKPEVVLLDINTGKQVGIFRKNELTGKALIIAEPQEYLLRISARGYQSINTRVSLGKDKELKYQLVEIKD